MMSTILWAITLLLLGSLVGTSAAVGICLLIPILRFGWSADSTAAAVVVGEEVMESDEGTYYYPVVEFSVATKHYRFTGRIGTHDHAIPRIGCSTEVCFRHGHPEEAQLHRFEGLGFALMWAGVGGALSVAVLWELLKLLG
jgi:hypothetical protein